MDDAIKNSELYKKITKKDFIYRSIYSLESYVFEKDLLNEKDYTLMLELRDPFNHEIVDDTIKEVKKRIDAVILKDDFLEAQVYFRPKKINEESEEIESRPIHSASIITLITSVVLLNSLLIEVSENKKFVELTELARILPTNFYGNIPSENPKNLFKPWRSQFREYTNVITQSYYDYKKTKQYDYEVTLDLENFYPTINPAIIYDQIIGLNSAKYSGVELKCLKKIVLKLLMLRITNLKEKRFKQMYYETKELDFLNSETWVKGVPQGLPHAYFFGNICMIEVAKIYQEIIAGEDGKAFFYVDDSVIYTNNLSNVEDIDGKIDSVNTELEKMTDKYQKRIEVHATIDKDLLLKAFAFTSKQFKHYIKVHGAKSEKSAAIKIQDTKYGQANLNAYSKIASMVSYDLSNIFSDTEEVNLSKKLEAIYQAVEKEIERVREKPSEKSDGDYDNTSSYIKILLRFKKFFKYRQKFLAYDRDSKIKEAAIDQVIENFNLKQGTKNSEKYKDFFDAYDEDILPGELRYLFNNSAGFSKKIKTCMDKFNENIYGNGYSWKEKKGEFTISYFHKMTENLSKRRNLLIGSSASKYVNINRIIKVSVWNESKSSKEVKESRIKESIHYFVDAFENYRDVKSKKTAHNSIIEIINKCELLHGSDNRYSLILLETDELYRIVMNAYFSELISVDTSDLTYLVNLNNKPIYYNEARLLFFLRNKDFNLKSFFLRFQDYDDGELLDYKLFEAIDYFENFVKNPVHIDNLILVHKYTSDIWKNGSKYLHFYTLHNQEHAIELIRLITVFTKSFDNFQISWLDYYILFISCYLHDISMVFHPNLVEGFVRDDKYSNIIYANFKKELDGILLKGDNTNSTSESIDFASEESVKKLLIKCYTKLDNYYGEYVRSNHQEQSAKFIRESDDFDFVEDVVKDIVAEVSQAHGYDVSEIYKTKSNAKDRLVSEKYVKILLRVADLLDISSNRIRNAILENNQNSMDLTTRFHWLSHKAISGVDVLAYYEPDCITESDNNCSWIGPGAIIENVEFVIYLNVKHQIAAEKTNNCSINLTMNKKKLNNKANFVVKVDQACSCEKCNFMCKWMKVKNDYLYNELEALQIYLNRSEGNLFKTNISIKYEFNDGAKRLISSEYETIKRHIEG